MRVAGGLAVLALVAATAPAQSPSPRPSPPRRFVIDSHQHYSNAPDYFDRLVKTYRPRNAMACVLTLMKDWPAVKKAAADYPDVVIPYGQILVDDPKALSEIETFAAGGAKGIKMHTPRKNWDDESYFPLYKKMQDLGLVALFHTASCARSWTATAAPATSPRSPRWRACGRRSCTPSRAPFRA